MTEWICQKYSDPVTIKNEILNIDDEKKRDYEIAIWALNFGFDELRPKPSPTAPKVVSDYYDQPEKIKKEMEKSPEKYDHFWRDPIVVEYFESKHKIENENFGNLNWLNELRIIFELNNDLKNKGIVEERLLRFKQHQRGEPQDWEE